MPWPPWLRHIIVFSVTASAGYLFVASANTAQGTTLRSGASNLNDLVREKTLHINQTEHETERLRASVTKLSENVANSEDVNTVTDSDWVQHTTATGHISGPGVEITLDDAPTSAQVRDGVTADDLVVHQQDVEAVVNALWLGNAEGVSVMGHRINSTTSIRCAGNTLRINGRVYSPPFRITAVGSPEQLTQSLENDELLARYRNHVRALGLGYAVSTHQNLTLPPHAGGHQLSYAAVDEPSTTQRNRSAVPSSP